MRRHATTLSVSLLTFFVVLTAFAAAYAQKKEQAASKTKEAEFAPLKESASLEETLSWLNDNLVRYGKFTVYQPLYEPGYRSRTRFLRLEAQGCIVTYRVREDIISGGGGNVAVSYRDRRGKLMQYDGGEFYVSDKERVVAIAGALRHAVALCKK